MTSAERNLTVPLTLTAGERAAIELIAEVEQRPVVDVLRKRADLSGLLREAYRLGVLCGLSFVETDPPLRRVAALGRHASEEELQTFWAILKEPERDELFEGLEAITQQLEGDPAAPGRAMRRYLDQAVVTLTTEGRPEELLRYAIRAQPWPAFLERERGRA